MASGALVLAPDEVADLLVLELLRGALVGLLALVKDVLLHPVDRCVAVRAHPRGRSLFEHNKNTEDVHLSSLSSFASPAAPPPAISFSCACRDQASSMHSCAVGAGRTLFPIPLKKPPDSFLSSVRSCSCSVMVVQ